MSKRDQSYFAPSGALRVAEVGVLSGPVGAWVAPGDEPWDTDPPDVRAVPPLPVPSQAPSRSATSTAATASTDAFDVLTVHFSRSACERWRPPSGGPGPHARPRGAHG